MMRISFITGDLDISADYVVEPAHIDQSILAAIDASLVVGAGDARFIDVIASDTARLVGSHNQRRRSRRAGRGIRH
ncbi:MAG TPA: hypothetical protein VGL83_19690 [Stellaceae bacterium]